jgi:hypothetical protein
MNNEMVVVLQKTQQKGTLRYIVGVTCKTPLASSDLLAYVDTYL